MKYYYITFRSVTHAQRGEQVLQKNSIRSVVLRTPKWMETKGCGYSLRLWTADISAGVSILRRENIPMRRVYLQTPDGTLEEVEL